MEKIMNETHIKVYGTDIEFTIQGNPTYPDILRQARQLKVRLPDQPIFQMTTTPNPDYWDQFKGEDND